jgi:murein tripeptide amidase MpaA
VEEDIDGDGRILAMRIPDANGPWKKHPDEPRLMVRRDPTETGGEYYIVLTEGTFENFDGVTLNRQRPKEGLDLNRNFPANWRQEAEQAGAGFYPGSEPETHAMIDFIARHPNITGAVAFHTWSGVLLRPYDSKSDEEFAPEDLWTYKAIGDKGTDLTGYPNISVFHDFRYHPKQVITGGFDEWMFDHMGVFAWTVEIWSPQRQAGIEEYKFIDWYREHPIEDDLKMLEWSDETLNGEGYVDWYEVEHPQLGTVELGGWNRLLAWRNPPPQFLEEEIAPFSEWLVWHALISPELALKRLDVTPLGDDTYHIRLAVENAGWLPTQVTSQAVKKKVVRGVVYEIDLPEGASLQGGKARHVGKQLAGRANTPTSLNPWVLWTAGSPHRDQTEWVVHAPQGGTATLIARHPRAGVVRTEVDLSE